MTSQYADLLVAFTNSEDHEELTDDLTTPAELVRWLSGHQLVGRSARASAADLALARDLRAGLRAAMVANHDRAVAAGDLRAAGNGGGDQRAELDRAAARLPLRLTARAGRPALEPVDSGVRGALASLLVAVNESVADGSWQRLKICSADECRWAYLDTTKNRSRTWCEWGCGNKAKTRSYRARKKAAAAPAR